MTNTKCHLSKDMFLFACDETLIPNESMNLKIKTHFICQGTESSIKGIGVRKMGTEEEEGRKNKV